MMAKLSDFLLKIIWKHCKDVVTCSLTLTLPWHPSFYRYVFFKNYIFILRELKGLLISSRRNRTILLISLNVPLSLMHLRYVFLHLKSTPQVV